MTDMRPYGVAVLACIIIAIIGVGLVEPADGATPPGVGFTTVHSKMGFTASFPSSVSPHGRNRYEATLANRNHYVPGLSAPDGSLVLVGYYDSGISWLNYPTQAIYCAFYVAECPSTSFDYYTLTVSTGNAVNLEQALYEKPLCMTNQLQGMWHFTLQGYPAMFQRCVPGSATDEQSEYDMLVVVRGDYCYRLVAGSMMQPPVFARQFLESFRFEQPAGAQFLSPLGRINI